MTTRNHSGNFVYFRHSGCPGARLAEPANEKRFGRGPSITRVGSQIPRSLLLSTPAGVSSSSYELTRLKSLGEIVCGIFSVLYLEVRPNFLFK